MKRSGIQKAGKRASFILQLALALASALHLAGAAEVDEPKPATVDTNALATNSTLIPQTNIPAAAPPDTNPPSSATPPPTPRTNATAKPQPSRIATSFRTRPGFKIELVASEPVVASPVAMAFDEDGRLFVAEMRDYPARRGQPPHLGQIRVLEDPQGEGVFSSSTIFATNLPLPSAVVCYGGGVYVAAAPDILFFQDTDGNGVSDTSRVVFTGFGATNAIDANAVPHSFYWGLDNRIYGASGGSATTITALGSNAASMLAAGRDFSFDPRALSIGVESGLALSGMTRDDWGRRFLCSNAKPFQVEVLDEHSIARNPYVVPSTLVEDMVGPAVPIFRYTPPKPAEPARKPATNDLSAAWLANARGAVVYRGALFPSNYHGNIFVADADARVIHRAIIREQGFGLRVERALEERSTEFLISTDSTFRPTQIINGPDGALYVADMSSGGDMGRIYRIAPSSYAPAKPRKLSESTTLELVTMLAHTNGFHRDTAARLLFERRDPASVALLSSMVAKSKVPLARAHALHALAGLGVLTDQQTAQAMGDPDWRVRKQATILAEGFTAEGRMSDRLWMRLRSLGTDPFIQVRLQAALTAGAVARPDQAALLRDVLARDPLNPWIQTAALSSAHSSGAALLPLLATDTRLPDAVRENLLGRLAELIGVSGRMEEVQAVIDYIVGAQVPQGVAFGLTASLGEGLRRTRSSLRLVDTNGRLAPVFALALRLSMEGEVPEATRVEAVRVLGVGPYTMSDGGAILLAIIGSGESAAMQSAALRSMANYTSPEVVPGIVRKWQGIPAALRSQAVTTLLRQTEQVPASLQLFGVGAVPAADVIPWQANLFRTWPDPAVAERATQIFGPLTRDRPLISEKLRPALKLVGVPSRGQAIFQSQCSACHTLKTGLTTTGPDLAGVKVLGRDAILEAIVEPSKRIVPGHVTAVISTHSGETLVGTAVRETTESIVVAEPGRAPAAWPRLNIESIRPQLWSIMPEGIERELNAQNLADLVAFLLATNP